MLDRAAATTRQANRRKRYRARQRNGQMVPAMPGIGTEEIEFLVGTRWLDEADAGDRREVGCAIARMLADAARRR